LKFRLEVGISQPLGDVDAVLLQEIEIHIELQADDAPLLSVEKADRETPGFDPWCVDDSKSLEAEAGPMHHIFNLVGGAPDLERRLPGPEWPVTPLKLLTGVRHATPYLALLTGGFGHAPSNPPMGTITVKGHARALQ
jgi:hypothetical protein